MYEHLVCMHLNIHVHEMPRRPKEGIAPPGTGIVEGCLLPCGCWELDLIYKNFKCS